MSVPLNALALIKPAVLAALAPYGAPLPPAYAALGTDGMAVVWTPLSDNNKLFGLLTTDPPQLAYIIQLQTESGGNTGGAFGENHWSLPVLCSIYAPTQAAADMVLASLAALVIDDPPGYHIAWQPDRPLDYPVPPDGYAFHRATARIILEIDHPEG